MSNYAPIAYTYDADVHCPTCAFAAFGIDENGFVPEDAEDSEGNPIGAVAPWDEWWSNDFYEGNKVARLYCGTCHELIEEMELED
jgi:hypothetical protein